ncbi:hypothetical protein PN419_17400 [Halorubrum ezzemoulense]|uniref:hypothetical protein n=1 Tax=Halorubrum ezzemoulense TaxID=337243 RepID=UPI00232EFEB8|nr:hypothetical protein [Halorubrum ezzemoulense]MDB9250751.1 hypothetical protein [Halorubrum ezzemoulense]MDB9260882.1 hypothetical protein [Halorubrum ezzemoulense]MDB9264290.1 hypothetical protein [Halorubrum ezzemoulense]MDB9267782.1 hypothetical protein [Halorubrum ezzemoulense]MDB9271243.1 hypothetical protein [Halorubrum ezzemoulense]
MYRVERGAIAAGAISVSTAAVGAVIFTKPSGYTPSFYGLVPVWVWTALVLSIVVGLGLLARGAFSERPSLFIRGALTIGASYAVLYFLPQAVGFEFWAFSRSDALMHFSYSDNIIQTGTNPARNMYPGTHYVISQAALVTGLPVETFQPILMYLVTFIFIAGCALLGRALGGKYVGRFVFIAAVPLVLGKYMQHLMPWFIAFSLLPITMFLAESLRNGRLTEPNQVPASICAFVLLFGTVFIHPMSASVVLVLIGCGIISTIAYNLRTDHSNRHYRATWGLLVVIPLATWYFSTATFSRLVRQTALSLASSSPGAATKAGEATESGYTTLQLVNRYIVGEYGVLILYLAAGGLLALWVGYRFLRDRNIRFSEVIACTVYVAGGAIGTIFLVFRAIITEFYRMNQLTLFGAILLLGLGMAALHTLDEVSLSGVSLNSVAAGALVIVVITAGSLAVFTVYDERRHVNQAELEGVEHHMTYGNYDLNTRSMKISSVEAEYTVNTQRIEQIPWENRPFHNLQADNALPDDLGYSTNESVASLFDNNGYIVISDRNQDWIAVEPPNRHQYVRYISNSDMKKLQSDRAASQVYDNGGSWIWWVKALN